MSHLRSLLPYWKQSNIAGCSRSFPGALLNRSLGALIFSDTLKLLGARRSLSHPRITKKGVARCMPSPINKAKLSPLPFQAAIKRAAWARQQQVWPFAVGFAQIAPAGINPAETVVYFGLATRCGPHFWFGTCIASSTFYMKWDNTTTVEKKTSVASGGAGSSHVNLLQAVLVFTLSSLIWFDLIKATTYFMY